MVDVKTLTFDEHVEQYKAIHKDETEAIQRRTQALIDLHNGDWQKHFKPFVITIDSTTTLQ